MLDNLNDYCNWEIEIKKAKIIVFSIFNNDEEILKKYHLVVGKILKNLYKNYSKEINNSIFYSIQHNKMILVFNNSIDTSKININLVDKNISIKNYEDDVLISRIWDNYNILSKSIWVKNKVDNLLDE